MRRLRIGDKQLRVREEGPIASSRRAPVMLIHGAGASSAIWIDVVKRIAPHRRVVALDLPGHGQSDPWTEGPEVSIEVYRDAVGTVCKTLGVERAILIGHSMGGAIALACALAWPERVGGMVLACSGARIRVAPATLAALGDPNVDPEAVLAEAGMSPSTPPEVRDRWRPLLVQSPRDVLLADLRACDGIDLRPSLRAINTATLAIGGADDLMLPPKLTLEVAAGLPNARAVVIPAAGHYAMLERPDAFHAALDPFLTELP